MAPCTAGPPDDFLGRLDHLLGDGGPAGRVPALATRLYDESVPPERRKALGQFFTPPAVARFMARWVLAARPTSLLDPAVGLGVFLAEALAAGPGPAPALYGFDIDPIMVEATRRLLGRLGGPPATLRAEDFVLARVEERFDAIVGNPPYIRHHALAYPPQVFAALGPPGGRPPSRLTNIYGLFLLRCHELLSARGRCALITPAEFLNADFGVPLKEMLVRGGGLAALLLFDHGSPVFDGALTTACITMVDKAKDPAAPVHLLKVSRLEQLDEAGDMIAGGAGAGFRRGGCSFQAVPAGTLDPARKWNSLFDRRRPRPAGRLVPLGALADSMRGIATGANAYFTLSDGELRDAGLGPGEVRPCLAKATFAPFLDFRWEDFEALRRAGRKIHLLDVRAPLSAAAGRYVRLGEAQGIHRRYLTAARSPWFVTERRPPAPILVTVFARGGFRFVHNRAGVFNLTAYHCIYPRGLDDLRIRALMAWLCSSSCGRLLGEHMRVYGDGLMKLEPRDLLRLPVPDVARLATRRVARMAAAFDALCVARRAGKGRRPGAEAGRVVALAPKEARCAVSP